MADSKSKTEPQFTHDCGCCHFLGQSDDGKADLYWCGNGRNRTYIARFGSSGHDYTSGIAESAKYSPYVMEALMKYQASVVSP